MNQLTAFYQWCVANPAAAVLLAGVACNLIAGLVPSKYHSRPWYGRLLALNARLAAATPPDAHGTFKLPGAGFTVRLDAPAVPAAPAVRDTEVPPAPPASAGFVLQRLIAALGSFAVVLFVLAPLLLTQHCSATPRQVVHVAVLSAGTVVAQLDAANRDVYTLAAARVRAEVGADGGHLADYDRAIAPVNREYEARVSALVSLDAALYAAAALNDATRGGDPAALRNAAAATLAALQASLAALQRGGLLPAVPIPPEVTATLAALTALAGPVVVQSDGGVG